MYQVIGTGGDRVSTHRTYAAAKKAAQREANKTGKVVEIYSPNASDAYRVTAYIDPRSK